MSEADESRIFNFLSTISHELRTPLNAIIGYSELLIEDHDQYDTETMLADLKRIHHAGRHLMGLIDEVVDLARIESGSRQVHNDTVKVDTLVKRMVPNLLPVVTERGNQFRWSVQPSIRLRTDPGKVTSVLRTLINRAARVTTEGVIELEVDQVDDRVLFKVRDSGEPVDAERLAKSFHPFASGEGGGFTSANRVVELLGGSIELADSGPGTTFVVTLPALDLPAEEPSLPPIDTGPIVLVVDDDPTVHDLMERYLEPLDVVMLSARSGPEAIRLAERHPPAVIALDVMMPDVDGWDTLAELKAHPKLAEVPVVMMSMADEQEGLGRTLGAADYLLKPIERNVLLGAVEKLMEGSRRRVLVVDDEPDARELTRRALMAGGYLVDEVADGEMALRYLEKERPDLILLDLIMPGVDGFTVVQELRDNPALSDIPVIVLTGKSLSDAERARLMEGAASILSKSGPGDVLSRIKDALGS